MDISYIKNLKSFAETLTLLYIEDDDTSRNETLGVLKLFFKSIITAENGKDGLEKYNNNKIDIIITDINMPKMNGIDMIELIREKDFDIPIFIVSAHNDTSFFLKSIKLGVDGYLIKPLESDTFINQVFKRLQRLFLQKEVKEYQNNLENKVQEQVQEIIQRDNILAQQTKLATMGEMIDVIAHQWKQPLGVMKLTLALLVEENEHFGVEITPQKVKNCQSDINKQMDHLMETLDNFRTFFRPNEKIEKISSQKLIDSVLNLLKDELINHNIFIDLDIDKDMEIEANINEIKHIFINLINNAKDAFLQNKIMDKKITIKTKEENGKKIFQVIDKAGGIPKDIIHKIFKPNFTTKENSGGTGIGLYMSEFIAKKNNATLEVENYESGAIFSLIFI